MCARGARAGTVCLPACARRTQAGSVRAPACAGRGYKRAAARRSAFVHVPTDAVTVRFSRRISADMANSGRASADDDAGMSRLGHGAPGAGEAVPPAEAAAAAAQPAPNSRFLELLAERGMRRGTEAAAGSAPPGQGEASPDGPAPRAAPPAPNPRFLQLRRARGMGPAAGTSAARTARSARAVPPRRAESGAGALPSRAGGAVPPPT